MVTDIRGHNDKDINVSILRNLCALFKASDHRNARKDLTLAMLPQNKINKNAYWTLYESSGGVCDVKDDLDEIQTLQAPREQPHCIFRLLNVLFNDEFKGCLIGLGGTRSCEQLSGRVSPDTAFWTAVQKAIVINSEEDINQLQSRRDVYEHYAFDPSVIVQHGWIKLKSIFANVRLKYRVVNANLKQSDTHDNDFWNFYNGQVDRFYLHQFIIENPGIGISVTASLPPI